MKDNNALILQHEDLEALYINGELVEQGEAIGEGLRTEAILTILSHFKVAVENTFTAWVSNPVDESYIYLFGCMPTYLHIFEMEYRTKENRISNYWDQNKQQ